jgi:drug/metabolite transporter (DMT)-like permease
VAFKHAPAAVVAPVEYTALIWGLGIDRVFWSVSPDQTMLLGAALVILAGLYVAWRERHPATATPVAATPADDTAERGSGGDRRP